MANYAWYSPIAAKRFGYSIYKSPSGTDIKATEVGQADNEESANPYSKWPDLIFMGVVTDYVQSVKGEYTDLLELSDDPSDEELQASSRLMIDLIEQFRAEDEQRGDWREHD